MSTLLAAFRTELRLRLRTLSTWGWWGLGLLLTAWGILLDVLAVGVDAHRPLQLAATSGSLGAWWLGAWVGSGTPRRHSLQETAPVWASWADTAWAIPGGRVLAAALLAACGSLLCMLYALVLTNYSLLGSGVAAPMAAALVGGTSAAWCGLLTPRWGSLPALLAVVALGLLAPVADLVAPALRPALPSMLPMEPLRVTDLIASGLVVVSLVILTPGAAPTHGAEDSGR